jgi:hypothetical protein
MPGVQSSFGKRGPAKPAGAIARARIGSALHASLATEKTETGKAQSEFGVRLLRWTGGILLAFLIFTVVFVIGLAFAGFSLRGQHGSAGASAAGFLLFSAATLALNCAIYGGSSTVAKDDRHNLRITLLALFIAGQALYLIFAASLGKLGTVSWIEAVGICLAAITIWRRLQRSLANGEPAPA